MSARIPYNHEIAFRGDLGSLSYDLLRKKSYALKTFNLPQNSGSGFNLYVCDFGSFNVEMRERERVWGWDSVICFIYYAKPECFDSTLSKHIVVLKDTIRPENQILF